MNEEHPFVATIRRYYAGCNTGDVGQMMSTFDDNIVHYFVDHTPVRGSGALASYWAKIGPRTRAQWYVDHAIVQGNEAVIEWSMPWTPPGLETQEVLRGTEWFLFANGKIVEVRSYHNNFYLHAADNRQLHDFPYQGRGYHSP